MFSCFNIIKSKNQLKSEIKNLKVNTNDLVSSILNDLEKKDKKIFLLKRENLFLFHQNKKLLAENQNLKQKKIKIPKYIKNLIYELCLNSTIPQECSICLNDINKENILVLDCGHVYCNECITNLNKCLICGYIFTL
jgi:hypothetical protein